MKHRQYYFSLALTAALLTALLASACAPASTPAPEPSADNVGELQLEDAAAEEPVEEEMAEAPMDEGLDRAPLGTSAPSAAGPEEADAFAGEGVGGGPGYEPPVVDQEFQTTLSAGEIDDNEEFNAYLQYRLNFEQIYGLGWVNDISVSERHVISVKTQNGLPVLGAEVIVYNGQELVTALRTPATGTVYFHPYAFTQQADPRGGTYSVTVRKDGASEALRLTRASTGGEWDVTLNVPATQGPVQLDVLFLLDATGSMSEEIAQLKDNILSISAQIEALPSQPDVRFGLVSYRDRGDEYVVRDYQGFTGNVSAFQNILSDVRAEGGGDTPEALNEAFAASLDTNWRVENTVSLIFLVADAPPHLDYANDTSYARSMQKAAELGIKVHPIASGGLAQDGEYIFRQIAQYTGGHFIFLTYESTPQSSGDPGREDLSVPEGTYSVEDLDALVVRLIREELAALDGAQ